MMEELDTIKIGEAVLLFMGALDKVSIIKQKLKETGYTSHEIAVAESLAQRNLFHFVFARRVTLDGQLEILKETIGEA